MNNNKYAAGGPVSGIVALRPFEEKGIHKSGSEAISRSNVAKKANVQGVNTGSKLGKVLADPKQSRRFSGYFGNVLKSFAGSGSVNVRTVGAAIGDDTVGSQFEGQVTKDFINSINKRSSTIGRFFGSSPSKLSFSDAKNLGVDSVVGNAFEAALTSLGTPFSGKGGNNAAFDFLGGLGSSIASKLKAPDLAGNPTDAKRTLTTRNLRESATKKFLNQLATTFKTQYLPERQTSGKYKEEQLKNFYASKRKAGLMPADFARGGFTGMKTADFEAAGFEKKFNKWVPKTRKASGGSISGSDTVPALLTPGEFVVNKSSAQSIGYSNLSKMNQTGVSRFQNGGVVGGIQRFREGGPIKSGSIDFTGIDDFFTKVQLVERTLTEMGFSVDEAAARASKFGNTLAETDSEADGLAAALKNDKIAIRDNAKAKKEEKNATKKVTSAIKQETQELNRSKPGGAGGGFRGAIGRTARELDPIAGAAQTFVFAGAAVTALTTQFSGLNDVTRQAITETSGFVTGIVGIGGTLTQIFTSMATAGSAAAASDLKESVASDKAAESDIRESAAGGKGMGVFSKALIGGAIAATGIAAVFKYLAGSARAQADAMAKSAADILQAVKEGRAD